MILKSLVLSVAVFSLAAIGGCAHKNASDDMGMKARFHGYEAPHHATHDGDVHLRDAS